MDFTMAKMEKKMKKIEEAAKKALQLSKPRDNAFDGDSGRSYSVAQSQVYVQTSTNGDKPRVYQESYMERSGPGGLKEMKKMVLDSEKGKKCCVGRKLGEKAHVVQREEDPRGTLLEEHQDLYNLEENSDELRRFHDKWKKHKESLPAYSKNSSYNKYLTKK
ncbi:hypothetical protein WDU94_005315 [Cyamophila willieti]